MPPPQDAPLPMFTKSDDQTEDGHAMMEFDTFQSLQNLSHAVRGGHDSVLSGKVEKHDDHQQICAHITARVYASPLTE